MDKLRGKPSLMEKLLEKPAKNEEFQSETHNFFDPKVPKIRQNPKKQELFGENKTGGRYKTRTCDLPHVKRMRYQLRQSSSQRRLF